MGLLRPLPPLPTVQRTALFQCIAFKTKALVPGVFAEVEEWKRLAYIQDTAKAQHIAL